MAASALHCLLRLAATAALAVAGVASAAPPRLTLERGPWRLALDRGVITELTHRPTQQTWGAPGGPGRLSRLRVLSGDGLEPATAAGVEVSGGEVRVRGADAELVTAVRTDGGDLLVTQRGRRDQPGLVSASWGLAGAPIKGTSVILPHLGGMEIPAADVGPGLGSTYPTGWDAPLMIVQTPGRGIAVWAEDPALRFKKLAAMTRDGRLDFSFETCNWAPFEDRADLAPVTWRVVAYQGDWRGPASRYRAVMQRLLQPPKPADFAPWVAGVQFVLWIYPRDFSRYIGVLRELAQQVDPGETLLMAVDSRQAGYDCSYPDYTVSPGFPEFTRAAQGMGYHVAAWASFVGVSPSHPLYQAVRPHQYRDPLTKQPLGWHWAVQDAASHAFISPASSAFRRVLTQALLGYEEAAGMEAIHLDVSAPLWNDGNGRIEGRTVAQGHRLLHQELARSLPGIVFSGESLHELTLGYNSFAQRWPNDLPVGGTHPVSAFLFHEFTRSYGYCMPKPGEAFESLNRFYEGWGVLPTLRADTIEELNRPAAQRIVRLAHAFQEHDLQPDFSLPWEQGTKFRWRGRDGVVATCRQLPWGVVFRCGGEPLYRRVEGVNRVAATGSLPGWFAYDGRELFGLDPAVARYLEPTHRDPRAAHVSALPAGVIAHDLEATADSLSFGLRAAPPKSLFTFRRHLVEARTGVIRNGNEGAMDEASGASFSALRTTVGGSVRDAIFGHPAWSDGLGDAYGEFRVAIPDGSDVGLDFAAGIASGAKDSDGVTFIVTVAGAEVFREHVLPGAWQERRVSLAASRGQVVRIRFTTDPGPAGNVTDDWAAWGDPCITERPPATTAPVEVTLPGPLCALNLGGQGQALPTKQSRAAPMSVYRFAAALPASVRVTWVPARQE
jgi:hypothetical protein